MTKRKRHTIIRAAIVCLAWAASAATGVIIGELGAQGAKAVAQPPRPDILFIIADDWSYPHAGAYGDRTVATPAFDRVAREGVLFRRAFTAST